MPFNGSGVFNRVYSWQTDANNNVDVRADRMDTDTNDIASGLSNCVTRDGQSPATANLPMGSNKITGLANGSNPADAVAFGQLALPAVTTPSMTNSWQYSGLFNTGGYYKDVFGIVHLQGALFGGTSATSAFTLPVGFRPVADTAFSSMTINVTLSNMVVAYITVAAAGTVTVTTNGSTAIGIPTDGISFRTT